MPDATDAYVNVAFRARRRVVRRGVRPAALRSHTPTTPSPPVAATPCVPGIREPPAHARLRRARRQRGRRSVGRRRATGDVLVFTGPSGGYRPDPAADWHLLVGDESALPAIAASLEALPADAKAVVRLVCDGPAHEIELARRPTSTSGGCTAADAGRRRAAGRSRAATWRSCPAAPSASSTARRARSAPYATTSCTTAASPARTCRARRTGAGA